MEEVANPQKPQQGIGRHRYTMVMIGEIYVGKLSLINQLEHRELKPYSGPKVGGSYSCHSFDLHFGKVELSIYETRLNILHPSVAAASCNAADAIVYVFDTTDIQTFDEINEIYVTIRRFVGDDKIKVLVGNKCDLESKRKVTREEAEKYAEANDMKYFETSAVTGQSVEEMFRYVAEQCVAEKKYDGGADVVDVVENEKKNSGCK